MTYEGGEKVEKQQEVERDMVATDIRVFVGINDCRRSCHSYGDMLYKENFDNRPSIHIANTIQWQLARVSFHV